jgi:hypothetical protein
VAVGDAVAGALLISISGALTLLSVLSLRRYQTRAFALLSVAFFVVFLEGVGISLLALGVISSARFPLLLIAAFQVFALLLIYVATLPRG